MKRFLILAVLLIGIFVALGKIRAQTAPQVLITWQAFNYVPQGFLGKTLPMNNSPVAASAAILQNGKFLDTSQMNIKWLINNHFYKQGVGLSSIIFQNPNFPNSPVSVQANFPDFSAGGILNTVSIPVVWPQAVINSLYPANKFAGNEIDLTALPYFFNIPNPSALDVSWSVNGQSPSNLENPLVLKIQFNQDVPQNYSLNVNLDLTQKSDPVWGRGRTSLNLSNAQ